jgi:HTH-type transcriptional regulator / antitoxin HigA
MTKLIKTPAEHAAALQKLDQLMQRNPRPGTADGNELELLAHLIDAYERQHHDLGAPTPIQAIKFRMEQQSLKPQDLVPYLGSPSKVSEILNGKRPLTLSMLRRLHEDLGIPAQVLLADSDNSPQAQPANGLARQLVEGESYHWNALPALLGFKPHGYLTQDPATGTVRCGCFRLDYNPDAPDIVLPGTDQFIAQQALQFHKQRHFVPVFVKGSDDRWRYCGRYRVEAITRNQVQISLHQQRATQRKKPISMVLFLEKQT